MQQAFRKLIFLTEKLNSPISNLETSPQGSAEILRVHKPFQKCGAHIAISISLAHVSRGDVSLYGSAERY